MASQKSTSSRHKLQTATLGEFRKANRTKKAVHFISMNIAKTKFDGSTDTDFEKWFIPTIQRRVDTDLNIKFDMGTFHGYKLKANAIGEPFNSQKWEEPIPGQIPYPGEVQYDGEMLYENQEEQDAWKAARQRGINMLNNQDRKPITVTSDGAMEEETPVTSKVDDSSIEIVDSSAMKTKRVIDRTLGGKDPKVNPLAPYKLYVTKRTQKDIVNIHYQPIAEVSPIYNWKQDEIPVDENNFFENVKAFMVGSDALMCD